MVYSLQLKQRTTTYKIQVIVLKHEIHSNGKQYVQILQRPLHFLKSDLYQGWVSAT